MKNKNVNYILLSAVFIIWAAILYRIFSVVKSPDSPVKDSSIFLRDEIKEEDTSFQLIANYRDPFEGKTFQPVKSPIDGVSNVRVTAPPKNEKPGIDWTTIQYLGTIKIQKDDASVALVKIGGKTNMVEKGGEIGGVKLLQIMKDSIQVQYDGVKKVIKK